MNKVLALFTFLGPVILIAQTTPYFQQKVDHVINVTLNDEAHELDAEITTTYTNNSADELSEIWMHLWPNAYSSAKTAMAKQQFRDGNMFMFYALAKDLGGIEGLDFKVDGISVRWDLDEENPDIAVIKLNSPLAPGGTIEISTPFKVRIPSGEISRLGHVGESYQITQWYPKPAVYDRDGWHALPYLGQGEFFSEFGNFDVFITLPGNYTVGATGDMPLDADNEAEIKRLNKLDSDTRAYFRVIEEKGLDFSNNNEFPESVAWEKTLHYHQENVHDFAWFADKRFKVLKDSVELPHSGRFVTTWAMFTPNEEELWKDASDYLNKSTYYYSLWNGDYPYNHVTAVDGTISAGGGMEYPNVTVIGESGSAFSLDVVIAHEVGHNWFYGILGSNERTNAWMDEGLNSFNETRYLIENYEGKDLGVISGQLSPKWIERLDLTDFEYRWIDELAYIFPARFGSDQALQCHSDAFSSINYGAMVYKKTAAVFGFLRQYLGTERFDTAMRAYFSEWKFKHPSPSDLQASLEKSCGEDLSWFFEGWIKSTEKNDWAIVKVKKTDNGTEVKLANRGGLSSPVEVVVFAGDMEAGRVWSEVGGPNDVIKIEVPGKGATRVEIDPGRYDLDYDRKNNNSKTSGIFKKVEPLQIRMGTRLEDGTKTQLFWLPVTAWNAHNGLMLGATFHNTTVPLRNFEWMVTPLVSRTAFTDKTQLGGVANIRYSNGPWNSVVRYSRFSTLEYVSLDQDPDILILDEATPMNRVSFSLNRKFNKVVNSPWSSSARYEYARVSGFMDSNVFTSTASRQSNSFSFKALKKNSKPLGITQNMGVELRSFTFDLIKGFLIEPPQLYRATSVAILANYSAVKTLNRKGKKITLSLITQVTRSDINSGFNFKMPTMGFGAQYDPMADVLLLDRGATSGLLSHQIDMPNGALPLNQDAIHNFSSVRIDYTLTNKLDVFVGALGINLQSNGEDGDYVAGLAYQLGPLSIQMPLYSKSMMDDMEVEGETYEPYKYWMFSLNLRDLNPWDLVRKTN
jgi:hypothetical protein